MFAVALSVELHIPASHSLKEKRAVVRPILDGLHRRFHVGAAEVAYQDKWQRAGLGVVAVSATQSHVCDILDQVERFIESFPEVEVIDRSRHWMELDNP